MVEDDGDDEGGLDVGGVLLLLPPGADEEGGGVEAAPGHVVSDVGLVLEGDADEGVAGLIAEERDEVDEVGVTLAEGLSDEVCWEGAHGAEVEAVCDVGGQDGADEVSGALGGPQQLLDEGVVGLVSVSQGTFLSPPGTSRSFTGRAGECRGKRALLTRPHAAKPRRQQPSPRQPASQPTTAAQSPPFPSPGHRPHRTHTWTNPWTGRRPPPRARRWTSTQELGLPTDRPGAPPRRWPPAPQCRRHVHAEPVHLIRRRGAARPGLRWARASRARRGWCRRRDRRRPPGSAWSPGRGGPRRPGARRWPGWG